VRTAAPAFLRFACACANCLPPLCLYIILLDGYPAENLNGGAAGAQRFLLLLALMA
jgi:hypothetical protein